VRATGLEVNGGPFRGNIGPGSGAPFPRPAYDSGWWAVAKGSFIKFAHCVGGNPENYVVRMQCKSANHGLNGKASGAYWDHLDAWSVSVCRMPDDDAAEKIRIRIWVIR
jgi:hypothetical protein